MNVKFLFARISVNCWKIRAFRRNCGNFSRFGPFWKAGPPKFGGFHLTENKRLKVFFKKVRDRLDKILFSGIVVDIENHAPTSSGRFCLEHRLLPVLFCSSAHRAWHSAHHPKSFRRTLLGRRCRASRRKASGPAQTAGKPGATLKPATPVCVFSVLALSSFLL